MTITNKNFEIKETNTYSLAALVSSNATTSIAQFLQLQTLCYYYDIAICCTESRALTCDLLTELNNAAQAGQLPARVNKRGRAYLNKSGIMVFSDQNLKALPYQKLIGASPDLSLSQIKHVNNVMLKNYKEKGLKVEEKAARLIPADVTIESITKTMMEIVKLYKITFDLNRSLEELYEAQNKCFLAIKADRLTLRKISGESYIEDQVIRFKVAIDPVENNIQEEVTKDVAHAASFYVFSKPSEDRSKRVIYIHDGASVFTLDCKYRTTVRACTCLAINHLLENGHSDATIYINKKAEDLMMDLGEFSDEEDRHIQKLTQENRLVLKVVNESSQEYIDFVAQCK